MSKLREYDPERMRMLMTALRSLNVTIQSPEIMYTIESVLKLCHSNSTLQDLAKWEQIIDEQIHPKKSGSAADEIFETAAHVQLGESDRDESIDYDAQYLKPLPDGVEWPEDTQFQWFAVDEDGWAFFYENTPHCHINDWRCMDGSLCLHSVLTPIANDWRETLTKRPENQ